MGWGAAEILRTDFDYHSQNYFIDAGDVTRDRHRVMKEMPIDSHRFFIARSSAFDWIRTPSRVNPVTRGDTSIPTFTRNPVICVGRMTSKPSRACFTTPSFFPTPDFIAQVSKLSWEISCGLDVSKKEVRQLTFLAVSRKCM